MNLEAMKNSSWKTTVAGVATALGVVATAVGQYFDADPLTNPDWKVVGLALVAAWGLISARDNDKSSEQVGAQKPGA